MKLLVFSDSHRSLRFMRDAVELERPDCVVHLGDLEEDARLLSLEYPALAITGVPGNCDGWTSEALQRLVTYNGVPVLMSHGHIWSVKRGFNAAIGAARGCGARVLLFGHTHAPYCRLLEDGLWVLNPGSVRQGDYGLVLPGKQTECLLRHI